MRLPAIYERVPMFYSKYDSPLAPLTLISDGKAICGLWIEGQRFCDGVDAEELVHDENAGGIPEMRDWLDEYFAGKNPSPSGVPLAPRGSAFRRAVWKKLLEIPYGELTTYGAISNELKAEGMKASAIAVGGAVGHNPISIIIPCHRVIGANGNLTGYGGGMPHKVWLLEHEGVDMSKLFVPTHGTAL